MTYIESVGIARTPGEALAIRIGNTYAWLKTANDDAYRNPTAVAFAVQELAGAVEILSAAVSRWLEEEVNR